MGVNSKIVAASIPPHARPTGLLTGSCPGCGREGQHTALSLPGDPKPDREFYTYGQCERCETVFFAGDELDPNAIYHEDYYSNVAGRTPGALKALAMTARNLLTVFAPEPISDAVGRLSEHPSLPCLRPIVHGAFGKRFGRNDRWIDIGCGHGELLKTMHAMGFKHLTGADPFMVAESEIPGLRLLQSDGIGMNETFDVVMMHKSLEHVEDPDAVLKSLHKILAPGGVVLIRVPVVGSYSWRTYGGDWGNLDAPRHQTLWSRQGFELAAQRAGWTLAHVEQDADARGIVCSEARRQGECEHMIDVNPLFTPAQHRGWVELTRRLNETGDADELAFYLTAEH